MSEFKLNDLMCFQLYQASRTMTRLYKDILQPLDLTYPQYIVMVLLWENGTLPFSEVSQRLQLKTGTLSPLLKRLEKDGWIERRHNKKDDRMVEVALGKKGIENQHIWAEVPCRVAELLDYDQDTYNDNLKVVQDINEHLRDLEGQE